MVPGAVKLGGDVGSIEGSAPATAEALAFASPKSSSFAIDAEDAPPLRVSMMLPGLRSRWTMPARCAVSSALAIWIAIRSAWIERQRAFGQAIGERLAFYQFQDQRVDAVAVFDPVDRADVRMVERREQPRFALEAGQPVGIRGEGTRQNLQGDVTIQLAVSGAIHFAHAAGAELRQHFVRAYPSPGLQPRVLGH